MISIATVLDSTTTLCLVPAAKPNVEGNVPVKVSANNGYDFTRESGQIFVSTAYINDIYPKMDLEERMNNKVDAGTYHCESAIGDGNVDHVVRLDAQ